MPSYQQRIAKVEKTLDMGGLGRFALIFTQPTTPDGAPDYAMLHTPDGERFDRQDGETPEGMYDRMKAAANVEHARVVRPIEPMTWLETVGAINGAEVH